MPIGLKWAYKSTLLFGEPKDERAQNYRTYGASGPDQSKALFFSKKRKSTVFWRPMQARSNAATTKYVRDTPALQAPRSSIPPIVKETAQNSMVFAPAHMPQEDFFGELKKHRFVISPPGNGLDTHATWERNVTDRTAESRADILERLKANGRRQSQAQDQSSIIYSQLLQTPVNTPQQQYQSPSIMPNSSYINALVRSLYDESQEPNIVTLSGSQPEIRSPHAFDLQSEPTSLFTRSANTWGGQFNPDHFQRNAFAMMSASPVNVENAAFAAMTAASHHKYEKNEKRSDGINKKLHWVNGSHVDETITYNQYTIYTAVLAPTTESPEIKQAILQQSVNSIKQSRQRQQWNTRWIS
ncbi:unnamed protein product [Cylindrotheca closterium]|uniref:Uncharacterized protein n=1 Tax=Cylindrotheca closterium TaxID=2856 RepID=A0AAD2JMY0_9STRA|nr:unnamed protein product [Cylindrotheca closterium]